jgi:hypothetical protein
MTTAQVQRSVINDFFMSVMHHTARRIAQLNITDQNAAANDYHQAISAMTVEEVEIFNKAIVTAAIQLAA